MPMILSYDIEYNSFPIINLAKNSEIRTKINNFNDFNVSVAFLGLFNEQQWKRLQKKNEY